MLTVCTQGVVPGAWAGTRLVFAVFGPAKEGCPPAGPSRKKPPGAMLGEGAGWATPPMVVAAAAKSASTVSARGSLGGVVAGGVGTGTAVGSPRTLSLFPGRARRPVVRTILYGA